jgi:ABC-type glycerol-3-phosphate transport system permease component
MGTEKGDGFGLSHFSFLPNGHIDKCPAGQSPSLRKINKSGFRQGFAYISSIPKDLEEAAEIDGASTLKYFRYILFPLLKIPIASLTIIVLPSIWNDFMGPYIYLDANNTTLLPLIQSYTGTYTTNYQVSYTGIFVSVIPLVLIYIMFRNWFIRGAMSGAIKG